LVARHSDLIADVPGWGHLPTVVLHDQPTAKRIAAQWVARGLDNCAQTYKADYPPALLTKLPLIAGHEVVAFLIEQMEEVFSNAGETRDEAKHA